MEAPWVDRILRVLDHIQSHLDDEDLRPETLAELSGFSLHHFHRVFRGMVGESVMGCIRRLRLERAAQRLKYSETPVTDVALASGYQSHEAFTRAFRARFGMAPRDYRVRANEDARQAVDARIESLPQHDVLGVPHVGPYEDCIAAWDRLDGWLAAEGLHFEVSGSFGLVYDDPEVTDATRLRYVACVELPPARLQLVPAGFVRRTIPSGRYAIGHYVGPYEEILETYVNLLGRWLPQRRVELHDEPVVEHYLNEPRTTPPAELRTEICVRIV